MSRIDVIVPCYKYAHFLRSCVASVTSQPVEGLRVLIIDDASPDNTAEVARELAASDSRITFRRHDTNRGHIDTYNEGLEWASADHTLLLSADDLLTPGSLKRALELLDAHPEIGLVYGRQLFFESDASLPRPYLAAEGATWTILRGSEFLEMACRDGSNPVATPTAVVRTRTLRQVGYYRKDLPHTADMELWLRVAVHSSIGIIHADQAFKRMHDRNMQLHYVTAPLGDLRQRKAAFDIIFRDFGKLMPDQERLQQAAMRSLAEQAFWAASSAFSQRDNGRCEELLHLAADICPHLRESPQWQRLLWKRRVGLKLWCAMRPLVGLLRGRRAGKANNRSKV